MIYIESKRRKLENIEKEYPGADILDITSASMKRYAQILSPFYPHMNIPIPFSPGFYATCVEAIWQGLKVFQNADVDFEMFNNATMKNLKRTVRRYGKPLGHRKGVYGTELLDYFTARRLIYLPTYRWVLENVEEVKSVIAKLKERNLTHDIVLLDYNLNEDFRDLSSPLSHAALVKLYIEGKYPNSDETYQPIMDAQASKGLCEKHNIIDDEPTLF